MLEYLEVLKAPGGILKYPEEEISQSLFAACSSVLSPSGERPFSSYPVAKHHWKEFGC